MNPIITVDHVLTLFPHRKKSWAYRELQSVKDALNKRFVTLTDLAKHLDWDLSDMQARLVGTR